MHLRRAYHVGIFVLPSLQWTRTAWVHGRYCLPWSLTLWWGRIGIALSGDYPPSEDDDDA